MGKKAKQYTLNCSCFAIERNRLGKNTLFVKEIFCKHVYVLLYKAGVLGLI